MNTVPCPGRIMVDLGEGFTTGCVLGSMWYFTKGAYYSIRRERIKGGLLLLRSRAPILGGSFGMWACIYSLSCCTMVYLRKREDAFNSVIAGFSTGFILAIRGGVRNAFKSGLIGGVFLGIIETVMIIYQQKQRRDAIIAQNKEVAKMKGDIEKQYGHTEEKSDAEDPFGKDDSYYTKKL